QPQMLAAKVPADVHEFDGVQRASPRPRSARRVRRLTFEEIFDGDEPGTGEISPGHTEVAADVRVKVHVDILEEPVPHEPGLSSVRLVANARPEPDGAL